MNTSKDTEENGDEHDGEADHTHLIFRKFQLWNQLSSTVLLIFVIALGLVANVFICYCIYRKKIGTKYVNPVLLALSLKNIIAISTCVPLATVMLNVPSTIVKLSCDIQENITFIILFAGYLFPMLLSMVQCDHVLRPRTHLIGGNRVNFLVFLIAVISVLMGVQSKLSKDDHGCHLWSIRTDFIVLSYIYSIASVFLLTLVVMVTCYMMIYFQARASQAAIETSAHKEQTTEGSSMRAFRIAPDENISSQRNLPLRRKMTTAILKPMFCIVVSNVLSSFPWIILYAFTVYDQIENSSNYAEVRILTMSILYTPIASDPIIFLAFSTKGRAAIRSILRRNRPTVTPYPTTANVSRQNVTTVPDSTLYI